MRYIIMFYLSEAISILAFVCIASVSNAKPPVTNCGSSGCSQASSIAITNGTLSASGYSISQTSKCTPPKGTINIVGYTNTGKPMIQVNRMCSKVASRRSINGY